MKKIKGLRWFMIGLVAIGIVINYLDRNALAVGASTINKELGTTTQQYSYIVASFQASYAIMQPFAGYIIDFLGTRTGLAIFAIGWSIVSVCHAFVGSWFSLAFLRGLLGVSESAVIPGGLKASQEWFPAKERSMVGAGHSPLSRGTGSRSLQFLDSALPGDGPWIEH